MRFPYVRSFIAAKVYFIGGSRCAYVCACACERARQAVKSSAPVLWCRIHHLNTCLLVRVSSTSFFSLSLSPFLGVCPRSAGRVTGRDKSRTDSRASPFDFFADNANALDDDATIATQRHLSIRVLNTRGYTPARFLLPAVLLPRYRAPAS